MTYNWQRLWKLYLYIRVLIGIRLLSREVKVHWTLWRQIENEHRFVPNSICLGNGIGTGVSDSWLKWLFEKETMKLITESYEHWKNWHNLTCTCIEYMASAITFLQNNSHTAALGFTYCVLSDDVGGMSVFLFICFLGDVKHMKQLL